MNKPTFAFVTLVVLLLAAYTPNASLAQSGQFDQIPAAQGFATGQAQPSTPPSPVNQNQLGQSSRQVPQPKGGVATVIGVDQPENCLRIRSGPGNSYEVIGCAEYGQQLAITGVWTSNDWAQLENDGWVYGLQIQTDLRPPATAYEPRTYVEEEDYPVAGGGYSGSYLPDYGYQTYWYGGIPLYVYDVSVWRSYYPRWWWRNAWWWQKGWGPYHKGWGPNYKGWGPQYKAWNRNFKNWTGAVPRNFVNRSNINRGNFSRANIAGFNTNRFQGRTSTAIGSARTFSTPNVIRSGRSFASPNVIRSVRSSSPGAFRMGTSAGRSLSSARIGGFSGMRMGSSVGRAFGGGGGGGRRR